jgi:hypothetical protein
VKAVVLPAGLLAALLAALTSFSAQGCELVLSEHRSQRELLRLPLDVAAPAARIAFEHSVLGTTVTDHYRFEPHAVLVQEDFEGSGYGLPHMAAAGETLQRRGDGWQLMLRREVQPLVVRPLPALRMRLELNGTTHLLGRLSGEAIEINATGCGRSG